MRFTPTGLEGAYVIDVDRHEDDRGFFARTYCEDELRAHGLVARVVQASVSSNHVSGTLRGMHYQVAPHEEVKLISCVRGRVYDVIIDLRPPSPTYRSWFGIELAAERLATLYVPGGFAHGFLTLADDTVVSYQMSERHHPGLARGVRWNDPAFAITWPASPSVMADRDRHYPDYDT